MMSPPFYLRQIEAGPMENFVYLVGDRNKRECVMIDPAWEVDRVLNIAGADGMKVTGGLVTHTHFDHVNGVEDLIAATQGKIYVHKTEAEFLKGLKGHVEKVEAGFKLEVGNLEITFIHTPGHTPGSQCFLVKDPSPSPLPDGERDGVKGQTLISGDTLFINACGRCDLPGGSAEQMHESLTRLAKLGDDVILLPGHNYADEPTSTIGREKQSNPYYQCRSLSEFLAFRMGG